MKTFSQILLALCCLLFLFSCEKDEANLPKQEIVIEDEIKMPFGKTQEELESMGWIFPDTKGGLRTGQHVEVFYDKSALKRSTNPQDSIDKIINLKHVDSIRYTTYWTSPSITLSDGTTCWIYSITFYEAGNIVHSDVCFAKYRGITYVQYIAPIEGFDNDVFMFYMIRSSQNIIPYFDFECLTNKRKYQYTIRDVSVDGTVSTKTLHLQSNICTRNHIIFQKLFKP